MHEVDDQWDGTIRRIVVPTPFRDTVLKLVHEHSGHLSIHKMRTLLGKFNTWTGIHVDTVRHYSACPECQCVSRRHPKVAPLQEVPVITEPWERVASTWSDPSPEPKMAPSTC